MAKKLCLDDAALRRSVTYKRGDAQDHPSRVIHAPSISTHLMLAVAIDAVHGGCKTFGGCEDQSARESFGRLSEGFCEHYERLCSSCRCHYWLCWLCKCVLLASMGKQFRVRERASLGRAADAVHSFNFTCMPHQSDAKQWIAL